MEKMVRNNDLNAAIDTLLKNNKGIIETDVDEDEKTTRNIIPNGLTLPISNNEATSTEKTMTTKEVAEQLHTSSKVILENAKKCLPNKKIENGKATYWTEAEVTVLLDWLQNHNGNHSSNLYFESKGTLSTDLTPALKIKKAMELMQEGYEEELAILKAKNAELQPKAEFADKVLSSETLLTMSAVCKVLGLKYGCITLYKHLVKLGVLNQNHIPYQEYISRGYFKVCEGEVEDSYENVHVTLTTKVYQKGVNFIMKLLQKNNLFDTIQ